MKRKDFNSSVLRNGAILTGKLKEVYESQKNFVQVDRTSHKFCLDFLQKLLMSHLIYISTRELIAVKVRKLMDTRTYIKV